MSLLKKTAFSPDGSKFAYINEKEDLIIWDTASNKLINTDFIPNVNACTCIYWIPLQYKENNTKKAKLNPDIFDDVLLTAGTIKGDVLIYNIKAKNLYLHMASRHQDAINDMCLYENNNSLFTCSSDQHIAEWDVSTGRQLSKWKADENPVYSICVIDDNNLLSSSNVILWWNISKKTVLKKFSGHTTEIRKLLAVNVHSMKSCYFLSSAIDDTKINAWSLTSASEACVASFSLPFPPEDMDISKVSSKNKPLRLFTATKDGHLYLFEHILNGNISELVQPKALFEIDTECRDFSILSVKFVEDTDECIIAYGSSKSTIAFKRVKIKELLEESGKENTISMKTAFPAKMSLADCSSNTEEVPIVNGFSDSALCSYKSKLRSTVKNPSPVPDFINPTIKECSSTNQSTVMENLDLENPQSTVNTLLEANQSTVMENLDLENPQSTVNTLLEAIKTRNSNIIETIIENSDVEYTTSIIKILPISSLKIVLNELNQRLLQKYSLLVIRWLKEILRIHLRYLIQFDDTIECLNQTRTYLSSLNVSKTLHKMTVLQGLLNLQIQDSSSSESESGDDESMEL